MRIVDELKQKVFLQSSDFLDKLAHEWFKFNYNLLNDYGQKGYECSFISILTEEIHSKLPDYKIMSSFGLKSLPPFPPEARLENVLKKPLEDIRKELCEDYWDSKCKNRQCFNGEYYSSEIDGLIVRDRDFCLLEYETTRKGLCGNFMKFYRLRQLLGKPFESLFVTKATSRRQDEGSTTFESFNRYVNSIKPTLDTLLQNWKILEIVDLDSERNRDFHWIPQE